MKKIYLRFVVVISVMALFSSYSFSQKTIMFVGRDVITPTATFASDRDLYDSLKTWGYTIGDLDYYTSAEFNALTAGDFSGYDGVFINETVNSSDVTSFGTTLNFPLPCVNLEGYAPKANRWLWLADDATQFYQTPDGTGTADDQIIVIKDNSHYVTKNFNVNDEVIWSAATGTDIAQNEPCSFKEVNKTYSKKLAINKAHAAKADFWAMITIDSSSTFPNKMFMWGMNHVGIDGNDPTTFHYGTQAFFTIIKRACDWAFGNMEGPSSIPDNIYQADYKLVAFPVPASDQVTIRFHAVSPVTAKVALFNVIGQQMEILLDKNVKVGNNLITLDTNKYPAGIYYIRLEMEGRTEFAKIIIN